MAPMNAPNNRSADGAKKESLGEEVGFPPFSSRFIVIKKMVQMQYDF